MASTRQTEGTKMNGIGIPVPRSDAREKCLGRAGYLDERTFPGLLHARAVRSTRPRARILDIQLPELPEGYLVVDARDIPGDPVMPFPARDYPIFANGRVNYVGEAILLVVGPDREGVLDLCEQVRVTYEDIPPILSIQAAVDGSAPPLTGDDNVYTRRRYARGDVDAVFASAPRVFSGTYTTGYQDHFYLETLRMVACPSAGGITFHGPLQVPESLSRMLAQLLACSPDRLNTVLTTVGGGFGGKIEMPVILAAHAALAAQKTGRPVAVVYDRHEDLQVSTKRHPAQVRLRSAVDAGGRLLALDVAIDLMAGAYHWFCPLILDMAAKMATNAYRVPNLRVDAAAYATNHVMPGAMRGFGAMQVIFALETHLSHMADALGVDPLTLKAANLLTNGDKTATGGILRDTVRLPEIIDTVARASGYREKRRRWQGQQDRMRKGIGAAVYAFGAPHTVGMGPRRRPRQLSVIRRGDGGVDISTTIVELGQGVQTTFRKIAADVLGVPLETIDMPRPRTAEHSHTGGTGASLGIVLFGKSLERAARRLKARWHEPGEISETEDYLEPDWLRWDENTLCGDAYHTYSWGAAVVEVAVDTATGEVAVTGVWTANDFGTPIDETIARGQVDGGVVQGIGHGLLEHLESRGGVLQQTSPTDYVVATAMDMPAIWQDIVPSYYPDGPFGAKSVGEMPIVGGAPAVVEAVGHACGIRLCDAPVTPERILDLMAKEPREPIH